MRKCALLVLAVVFGWSSGAWGIPANNSNTQGLVAAYEFTGNADDVSGNGNDGVVHGSTLTADRFGNANSAYSFDGSNETRLTNRHRDEFPAWNPGGSQTAFTSLHDGNGDIFVMDATDGSNPTNLTPNSSGGDYRPAWSPDGTQIAFSSTRDGNYDIYVMNASE